MEAKVTSKEYKHCDLVEVVGQIDSSTSVLLGNKLRQIMREGRYRIVVSLEETDAFMSSGLRALFAAAKECHRFNRGDLRLVIPKGPRNANSIRKAFLLSGFDVYFTIFETVADAVGSF